MHKVRLELGGCSTFTQKSQLSHMRYTQDFERTSDSLHHRQNSGTFSGHQLWRSKFVPRGMLAFWLWDLEPFLRIQSQFRFVSGARIHEEPGAVRCLSIAQAWQRGGPPPERNPDGTGEFGRLWRHSSLNMLRHVLQSSLLTSGPNWLRRNGSEISERALE